MSLGRKFYFVAMFVSIAFFFVNLVEVAPIVVTPSDLLGLGSHLTIWFWVGDAIIVICSILAFFDSKIDELAILSIVCTSMFFNIGASVFLEANPRPPSDYYPISEVQLILANHSLSNLALSSPLSSYINWPALHFISASFLQITNIPLISLVKYSPLFWGSFICLITYSIAKHLGLPPNRAFLVPLFTLYSFFLPQTSISPFGIAIILCVLFLFLIIKEPDDARKILLLAIVFFAIVLTHYLAGIVILASTILFAIYRKKLSLILLVVPLFLIWYAYPANQTIFAGANQGWLDPFVNLFRTQQASAIGLPSPLGRVLARDSMLFYMLLYIGGAFIGVIISLKVHLLQNKKKKILTLLTFVMGASVIVITPGFEVPFRVYAFALVPAILIILLVSSALEKKFAWITKISVVMLILIVLLSIPAIYGQEVNGVQVLKSELSGAQFFAKNIVYPYPSYFYAGQAQVVWFYNPVLAGALYITGGSLVINQTTDTIDFSPMDNSTYVILTIGSHLSSEWNFGHDFMDDWRTSEVGNESNIVYMSGGTEIYLTKQPLT